jgi:hypothetical protein
MWLVQYTGIRCVNVDKMAETLVEKGIPFRAIGLVPFSNEITGLDDVDLNGNVMAYGSCKLVYLIKSMNVRPGVYFDYSTFNVLAWNTFLPYEMLNRKPDIRQISELRKVDGTQEEKFLRPVMDLKLFAGSVKIETVSYDEFFDSKLNGDRSNDNALVAVSNPQYNIKGEWRCFIVNRKFVTGSQYRNNGFLDVNPSLPRGLEEYVERICDTWLPHDTCVMDVAIVGRTFKVVEFNGINASGLYAADVGKLVDALQATLV